MNRKILIRTDASAQIGAGHLMRMLSLGQLLSDSGFEVHFATIPYNPSILGYLKKEPFQLHYLAQNATWDASSDLKSLLFLAFRIRPEWIVLDGCQFHTDYEKGIKQGGFRLLRVNDVPASHCVADVLLNQNYGAENMKYSVENNTHILAGLKYLLLRREFLKANVKKKRFFKGGSFHLLVSMGGGSEISDSLNLKIVEGFSGIRECGGSVSLIIGKMGRKSKKLVDLAKGSTLPVRIITDSRDIAAEMLKSDIAIVSCGSTMWELLYMKVPFLAVSLTEVQRDYLKFLAGEGLCVNLGCREDITPDSVRESVLGLMRDEDRRRQIGDKIERIMDRRNSGKGILEILDRKSEGRFQYDAPLIEDLHGIDR